MDNDRGFLRLAGKALLGAFVVGLTTAVAYRLRLSVATSGFLLLLVIVVQARLGGLVASAIVSVIATACLDYFMVPPVLEWQIADPINMLALSTFLATALVITRLESKMQEETRKAERRGKSLEDLYEVTRQLLELRPDTDIAHELLVTVQRVFELKSVCIFDRAADMVRMEGASNARLAELTQQACLTETDSDDSSAGISLRCLRTMGATTGAIGFEALHDPAVTASALSALTAAAFERMRSFQETTSSSAAAETEVFRGIVLDVLAHEFKTPLATIAMAAGAIRESGDLLASQLDMAETIEAEASRLGSLTSRLLRVARLDRAEVKLYTEQRNIGSLVSRTVGHYSHRADGGRIEICESDTALEAMVDSDLFSLALSQLLENATKYSPSGTTVSVSTTLEEGFAVIRVANHGSSIPEGARAHIFERFYRAADARQVVPGSGLGLYVARKIALAHGGSLDIDDQNPQSDYTVFALKLPIPQTETDHVATNS